MKRTLLLLLATCSWSLAQEGPATTIVYQSAGTGIVTGEAGKTFGLSVQGAPYSATVTNESVQTLADGNRIIQSSSGTTARDSEGRTRQDTALPAIGTLSAANAPHLVFIMDPVAQASYTLNLTDKTAQKLSMPPGASATVGGMSTGPGGGTKMFFTQVETASAVGGPLPPSPRPMVIQKSMIVEEQAQVSTEDLGSQTMEGLLVKGARITHTIPAGQIGNEKPLLIVTEVWTSPDLKTVVYSKRSDPRMGEQTFKLTNIARTEPDPSLFTVPPDFKLTDGPQNFIYRTNH